MNPLNRPGIHKTGMQMLDNSLIASNPLAKIIKLFVSLYRGVIDFMIWASMMRAGARPLNELTMEGLYMKELEIFYFDFFEYKDWEKTKDTIRCLTTSIVLGIVFYLMATYLMDLDLRVRVIATCIVSTLLTLLLSYSPASRAVTFLMIPSMARGSLRNALLIGSIVLVASGPALTLRNNLDSIASSKACLHEQYFDIVFVVKSLHGKNVVSLLLVPVRMVIAAVQLVAEILYRVVHSVFIAIDKLIKVMQRLYRQLTRMLDKLRPAFSLMSSCQRLTRRLSVKFRRSKILFGLVQMVVALFNVFRRFTNNPPLAVPTIGYLIHKIGNEKVCTKLRRARVIYDNKKKIIVDWFMNTLMPKLSKVKAVRDLINDAMGPDTRVTIRMTGGIKHQLDEMKRTMQIAVAKTSADVKRTYRTATWVVQLICSVLSLLIFSVSLLMSILFYRGYMQSDNYENNYVTAPFLRLEELEPPILPLDAFEKSRVSVLADAMISDIVRRLGGSELLFTILRLIPFIVVIIAEWVSYALALFFEETWNKAIELERSVDTRLAFGSSNMHESNPMALLLSVVIQVQGVLREVNLDVNILACSPKAAKPNWAIDVLVCLLLLLYTAFTMFGPFFLKLRHHIMLGLEPTRSVHRAVWLRREIQADRQLMPANRDLFKMSQEEQENSSIQYLFNTYVKANITSFLDTVRSLFNLPTIRCTLCGVRGNLSMKNFNDFFTVCDSCESSICAPCAHYTDQDGAVKLRERCPNCGLKMEDVEIDAEEIEDEDPINDMLYNFLDLTPGYKVSRSALEAQLEEARAYREAQEREVERGLMATLGPVATIDPNAKVA